MRARLRGRERRVAGIARCGGGKVENLRYGETAGQVRSRHSEVKAKPIREILSAILGFVQAFRPFSTHLVPDGSGEDADLRVATLGY